MSSYISILKYSWRRSKRLETFTFRNIRLNNENIEQSIARYTIEFQHSIISIIAVNYHAGVRSFGVFLSIYIRTIGSPSSSWFAIQSEILQIENPLSFFPPSIIANQHLFTWSIKQFEQAPIISFIFCTIKQLDVSCTYTSRFYNLIGDKRCFIAPFIRPVRTSVQLFPAGDWT